MVLLSSYAVNRIMHLCVMHLSGVNCITLYPEKSATLFLTVTLTFLGPLKAGLNTPQQLVIYLLNDLMTSQL